MVVSPFVDFAFWIVLALAAWGVIFFLRPAVARAKFERLTCELRDEAEDAMIAGLLPRTPEVEHIKSTAEAFTRAAPHISFARTFAIEAALREAGRRAPSYPPVIQELTRDERARLTKMHRRLVRALADYMTGGSAAWLVLEPCRWLVRLHLKSIRLWPAATKSISGEARRRAQSAAASFVTCRPQDLAERYTRDVESGVVDVDVERHGTLLNIVGV
jgi:hypothetical protein